MRTLQLAVSEFAVPSPRSGSIEAHSGFGGLPNVGGAIHSDFQARRRNETPAYQAEKWLSHSFDHDSCRVSVSGRMDGFIPGSPARIEEIKSAYNTEALMASLAAHPHHPYKLQLRVYGFIHFLHSGMEPELSLQIVNARTRTVQALPVPLDPDDLRSWLARRLGELAREQEAFDRRIRLRRRSAGRLAFPFPQARPGQQELMQTIEEGLRTHKNLVLQAPTGLGKTAGVLFPVLRDSLSRGQKTIYVTAKNSQHAAAEDAVKRLQESGVKLRSVTIHAKAKMCFKDEPHCDPQTCEFARRHYDKTAEARLPETLARKKRLSAGSFRNLGRRHEVCPFELQMEAAARAEVVICDYNYVFSPRHALGRLTHNGWTAQRSLPNLIVDEAHNLPARAAEYHGAGVSCGELERLRDDAPGEIRGEAQSLLDSARALCAELGAGGISGPTRVELDSARFSAVLARAQELTGRYLSSGLPLRQADPVLRACGAVSDFAQALDEANEDFFVSLTPAPAGAKLRLTCCDASPWLKATYAGFAHTIAFSATLKPFAYYQRLLGLDDDTLAAEFTSPFPRAHRKLLVIPQVSTKMRDRPGNTGKIKAAIERIVQLKAGNYFVFFPSFDFMDLLFRAIDLPGFRVFCQERDMKLAAVKHHLELLREGVPTVIFAVQGGVFAEGVDYPGDMLIGALIVGPALPGFDFEREQLRLHYERKHGQGFDFAYTYPAMARVVQSAGRVIRSPSDRGLIVLLDRRFTQASYRDSMPRDWLESGPLVSSSILDDVRRFWSENEP